MLVFSMCGLDECRLSTRRGFRGVVYCMDKLIALSLRRKNRTVKEYSLMCGLEGCKLPRSYPPTQ